MVVKMKFEQVVGRGSQTGHDGGHQASQDESRGDFQSGPHNPCAIALIVFRHVAERKEDCGNHPGNPDLPSSAEEIEDTPGRTQHEREPQEPDRNSDESCRRELSAMDVKEEKQDVMGQEP